MIEIKDIFALKIVLNIRMIRPNEKLVHFLSSNKDDLEKIRKELIENFFQPALTHSDIVIKRKLGILTDDLYEYYRYSNRLKSFLNNEKPKFDYDEDENYLSKNLLIKYEHRCKICPGNFVSIHETTLTSSSSSWSHVYMCDICHCTRALEDNMIRHLENEFHCSASEYLADSSTMILQYCVRRNCVQLNRYKGIIFETLITCPICFEPFSNVNSCGLHTKFVHNLDYIYSIASISRTLNLTIQSDEAFQNLSLFTKYFEENNPELQSTEKIFFLFLCPILKCDYQTIHFSQFKTHLLFQHKNSFDPIYRTIQIKIKELLKPYSYMHITIFRQKTQRDIDEELQTLETLEQDIKYLSNHDNIRNLIQHRYNFLKNL